MTESDAHPYDLSLRLRRDRPSTGFLRHLSREALGYLEVVDETIRDIELALTEACAHVLDRPSRDSSFVVRLRVWPDHGELSIRDDGAIPWHMSSDGNGAPNRGEGMVRLTVMRALMDDVQLRAAAGGGTYVVLVKRLVRHEGGFQS